MTRFTDLVGCTLPLQQAGMSGTATPPLAAAVANAGALGMIGIGRQNIACDRAIPRRARDADHRADRRDLHRPLRATRCRRARCVAASDHRVLLRMARRRPRARGGDLRLAGRIRRRGQGGSRRRLQVRDRPGHGGRRACARPRSVDRVAAGRSSSGRRSDRGGRGYRQCRGSARRDGDGCRCGPRRHTVRRDPRVLRTPGLHRRTGHRDHGRFGADRGVRRRMAECPAPRVAFVDRRSDRCARAMSSARPCHRWEHTCPWSASARAPPIGTRPATSARWPCTPAARSDLSTGS